MVQWKGNVKRVIDIVRLRHVSEKQGHLVQSLEPSIRPDSCLQVINLRFSAGDWLTAMTCALGDMNFWGSASSATWPQQKDEKKLFLPTVIIHLNTPSSLPNQKCLLPHYVCSCERLVGISTVGWRSAFSLILTWGTRLSEEAVVLLFS